jgi:small subunit ribosomal protein S21
MAHYHRWLPRVIRGDSNAALQERGGVCVVEVKLDDVDRIEWALKTFKKKVQRAGVLQDLRRKRHYVKPSEARQQKAAAARRRKRSRN